MSAPRDRRAGFILVAVLMIMGLMASLVGAVALVSRSAIGTVKVDVDRIVGDALMKAGLEIAAWQLVTIGEKPSGIDGQLIRLDDGTVTLYVQPTAIGADLNGSPPPVLEAAYRAAKLKGMRPRQFAERVADWRDPDDLTGAGTSEADAYAAAGLPFRPANDAFRRSEDLQWVMGVSPADVERLLPYVTVLNPKGSVNLFDAPRELLEALPGFRKPQVERILRLRTKRTEAVAAQLLQVVPDAGSFVNADLKPDQVFKVRLEVRPERGAARTVEAVLVRDPTGVEPYRVVDWQELAGDRPGT